MHIAGMDVEGLFLPLRHLARDLPANGGEFTFEIPHPCLTGVGGDNVGNSRLREAYMLRYEPMLAQLAWQQIAPGDVQLFVVRIARERNNLHAVTQSPRDGIGEVGGDDKHGTR